MLEGHGGTELFSHHLGTQRDRQEGDRKRNNHQSPPTKIYFFQQGPTNQSFQNLPKECVLVTLLSTLHKLEFSGKSHN